MARVTGGDDKRVKIEEVERFRMALEDGDWLALYQHALWGGIPTEIGGCRPKGVRTLQSPWRPRRLQTTVVGAIG